MVRKKLHDSVRELPGRAEFPVIFFCNLRLFRVAASRHVIELSSRRTTMQFQDNLLQDMTMSSIVARDIHLFMITSQTCISVVGICWTKSKVPGGLEITNDLSNLGPNSVCILNGWWGSLAVLKNDFVKLKRLFRSTVSRSSSPESRQFTDKKTHRHSF